jgi:hypothetical protein
MTVFPQAVRERLGLERLKAEQRSPQAPADPPLDQPPPYPNVSDPDPDDEQPKHIVDPKNMKWVPPRVWKVSIAPE